jgi:hypothetical protein
MKPADALKWLHGFALPLAAGGDVRVSSVVGQRELDTLLGSSPLFDRDEKAERLAEARHAVAAELLLSTREPELDAASITLAAAVQNLLFLSHPAASGTAVGRRGTRRVADFTVHALSALGPPSGPRELVERHSMIHLLFALGRDDVRVSFWAGRREFKGAEPPARLLKWATVRRVHEERWRVSLVSEAITDPLKRSIVLALLAASPLTDLLEPLRLDPIFDLFALAPWLREDKIARAVADRFLTLGVPQIAAPLAGALVQLFQNRAAPDEVRLWTRFACHLQLLRYVLGPDQNLLGEVQALAAAHPNVKDFFGLFAAAQRVGLGRPDDLERTPALAARVQKWETACATVCGAARVAELESSLRRAAHLSPHSELKEGTA